MKAFGLKPGVALALGFAVIALLWGGYLGLGQLVGRRSPLDGVEYLTLDWRFRLRGPRPPPGEVVIVAIDDETTRLLGAFTPPRDVIARIVDGLARAGADAVALDIAFLDPGPPEPNRALAGALAASPTVVAAVAQFDKPKSATAVAPLDDLALAPRPSTILWPVEPLRAATRASVVNVSTDAAGAPRFVPLLFRDGEGYAPAFALEAAAALRKATASFDDGSARVGGAPIPLDLGFHLPLNYYGPRGSFTVISAARVLAGELAPGSLRGKIAVVGATAAAVGDRFATPFDLATPGVEIQATAIANLLSGGGLARTLQLRRLDAATAIALPLLLVGLIASRRPLIGLSVAALAIVVWLAITVLAFERGLWLAVATPLAAAAPIAVGFGAARVVADRRRASRLERAVATLAGFQSPALLARLLAAPDFLREPVRLDAAVVFVDLAGFTGASERLGPLATRDFIGQFQSIVGRVVAAFGGVVIAFMGDGAMILFGLPDPRPDDAARALRAVKGLREALEAWLADGPGAAAGVAGARFGATWGVVAASRLSAAGQDQITALGDPVNVASRLMEVGKQRGRAVVVSEGLVAAAGASGLADAAPGEEATVDIRGRLAPMRVRLWR
ncbi:MAG: adenylate/guanylate cyclase domain-containing protein [Pseudomonadota bacterium]|nr:adenylate/guanylate cyclase domain-containing protein [Pseudomonadota bacterium]